MAGGDQQCANDADTELTMAAGGILGVVLSKKNQVMFDAAPASQLAPLCASCNTKVFVVNRRPPLSLDCNLNNLF